MVIVGAGFGGLEAARHVSALPVAVTVVDRTNHHLFQPLLYQVATAGLSPADIAAPIRWVLRRMKNAEVLLGEVTGVDLATRRVKLQDAELAYDYLVVATGARHSYFGHPEWEPLAPGLKTIEDALEIRRRVLLAFELAERQALLTGQHEMLNFVVIGGGPTGVELAGTLAEIAHKAIANDFRAIDPKRTRILLVEGGPRVLATYPEDLSLSAQRQLEKLGVEVLNSAQASVAEAGVVRIGEQTMPAAVTLWAAGVAASPLGKMLGAPVDKHGRVLVQADLTIPDHREIFVIGDLAALQDEHGKWLPGVAPVAIQQGRHVARLIGADLRREPRENFHYFDKGSLATIGRAAAVAEIGRTHISGFLAWWAWLLIHILYLIGFRNRVLVMIQWAWAYWTYQRSARLITGSADLPGWMKKNAGGPVPVDRRKSG